MRFVQPIFLLLASIPFFWSAAHWRHYGFNSAVQSGQICGLAFMVAGLVLLARMVKRKA